MVHKSSLDAKMYPSVNMYCLLKAVTQEHELVRVSFLSLE